MDKTVHEAKGVLMLGQCDHPAGPHGGDTGATEQNNFAAETDRLENDVSESEITDPSQDGPTQDSGVDDEGSHTADVVDEFKENTAEVKSVMEGYRTQQLQLEDRLSKELHQREVHV